MFRDERPPGRRRAAPRHDGCGVASGDADRAGFIAVEVELGSVAFARPDKHVMQRRRTRANATAYVESIAVTESPSLRVAGREVQMPCRDDDPTTQVDAAGWPDEGDATNRVRQRSACSDRWRNAEHRGIGERDLELRLGSRRTYHADVLEISLRSVHRDRLGSSELAGLGQRTRDAQCNRFLTDDALSFKNDQRLLMKDVSGGSLRLPSR